MGVSSTFIFLFILFGAYLEKTGLGKFFIDIANAIAGWASGGPAKVAVISSALQGTIRLIRSKRCRIRFFYHPYDEEIGIS